MIKLFFKLEFFVKRIRKRRTLSVIIDTTEKKDTKYNYLSRSFPSLVELLNIVS